MLSEYLDLFNYISKPLKIDGVLLQTINYFFDDYFFYCIGDKTLPWNDICYKITQNVISLQKTKIL